MTPAHWPPYKKLRPPFCRLGGAIFAAIKSSIWNYPGCFCDVGGYVVAAVADGDAIAAVADGEAAGKDAVNDLHPGAAGTEDVLCGGRVPIILLAQTKLKENLSKNTER